MAILSWNCRGLGNKFTVKFLRNLIYKHKPQIVFLQETKQKRDYLERLRSRFGFTDGEYVEPCGRAGGLTLWWNSEWGIKINRLFKNFIDLSVNYEGYWNLTGIYGEPKKELRHLVWEELKNLKPIPGIPWLLLGDFNSCLHSHEKKGGIFLTPNHLHNFQDFVDDCNLLDFGFNGDLYT